ncbi:JDVT-CTERM system CAAX-type protease [Mariprofundus erugo]|uniref:JDVT-CTERM system CAAX-type protease n=1 Tax=Mariprofundus erugo TaxID=2528639 RepID=A0A5R9GRQ8_9PROT|nr:JDVT-CTERM system glutamic-type intramembrane protease [Mariprofundus erugo]TLS68931.1 JDVT-CTERM system CAAX-type protease [Mariprofundus erugo]
MYSNTTTRSLHDKQWYAALCLPLPLWAMLSLSEQANVDIFWPLRDPTGFMFLILLYPFIEESVFRGLIQGKLIDHPFMQKKCLQVTLANLLTSLLFSAAHIPQHGLLMALLVIPPSMIFGYFRDRYQGWIVPSILLHGYYNLGYFLMFPPHM